MEKPTKGTKKDKNDTSSRENAKGKDGSGKDENEHDTTVKLNKKYVPKDTTVKNAKGKGATAKEASGKDDNEKKTKGKNDHAKDASGKDENEKKTKFKDESGKDDNEKKTKFKDESGKDDNETKGKDAQAKGESGKDDNEKKTKGKDAHAKDASGKDVNEKKTKGKDAKKDSVKGSKAKPVDEDASSDKEASSDEEDASDKEGGNTYDEFPPSPRRGKPPIHQPVRMRRVYYHDENDLADTLDDNPSKPHGVVADDLYSPWDEAVKSLRYASVISGLSMTLALVAEVAVNGTEKLTVDRVWLPVQFLRTVMNDKGETPPNILKFLEHIDINTKDTGDPHYQEVYFPV
ncbi:high mobility group nucleosome-binding domain-containing protein 5 isoform X1 [Halyomorpha halys]|uniref:high mobility group nucleosome-binding domain-containing protein 5 isoform X1 n=1 Tax=Halyomorpha halys TaxID=286706 RepID=UPI0006D52206|nr:high mobility group nucleosome-binding domain-containing protein 5 [Halyomorpha halys]